jgi:hypothetical protein
MPSFCKELAFLLPGPSLLLLRVSLTYSQLCTQLPFHFTLMAAIRAPLNPLPSSNLMSFSKSILRENSQDDAKGDAGNGHDGDVVFEIMTGSKCHDRLYGEPAGIAHRPDTIDEERMMSDFLCFDGSSSGSLRDNGENQTLPFNSPCSRCRWKSRTCAKSNK